MTTPTNPNVPADVTPVTAAKPGIPRAALLGGAVVGLGAVAAAAFYFLAPKQGDNTVALTSPVPPIQAQQVSVTPAPAKPKSGKPATTVAKQQARAAMGDTRRPVKLQTSFDNVPKSLGGTEAPWFAEGTAPPKVPTTTPPPAGGAAAPTGTKPAPIVQGKMPDGIRSDPFVSRLIVPVLREYAYTLAIPVRLAPPAKPILPPVKDIPPELRYGPLVFPGRVAGYLEFGGVSAILETGVGTGAFDIVQPGSTVSSGIPGVPPLTVESISNTELVLRSEDGRTAKVPLSGVPGGLNLPEGGGGGGQGGPPPGFGGRPGGGAPGGFPPGEGGVK